jgi:hypothetical protein
MIAARTLIRRLDIFATSVRQIANGRTGEPRARAESRNGSAILRCDYPPRNKELVPTLAMTEMPNDEQNVAPSQISRVRLQWLHPCAEDLRLAGAERVGRNIHAGVFASMDSDNRQRADGERR